MSTLNEITEKIHTINPDITTELLDLLYEYIMTKRIKNFEEKIDLDNPTDILQFLIDPLKE